MKRFALLLMFRCVAVIRTAVGGPGSTHSGSAEADLQPTTYSMTGSCADLCNAYNQALQQRQREELQLYVNRQKELASSQATAPLQQQIADLNKLVTDQQEQIKKLRRADAGRSNR